MPKIVEIQMESITPYSQSGFHDEPELPREAKDAYDARTWRSKCTTDAEGQVCIPAMALKQCLDATAKKFGMQVPGKGKSTFTKHFKSGTFCQEDVPLGMHRDAVGCDKINANADGVRGSGKRVVRRFPRIDAWKATAIFVVTDDTITPDVFEKHMSDAGQYVGIGRFRPENGGLYGKFRTTKFSWQTI